MLLKDLISAQMAIALKQLIVLEVEILEMVLLIFLIFLIFGIHKFILGPMVNLIIFDVQ